MALEAVVYQQQQQQQEPFSLNYHNNYIINHNNHNYYGKSELYPFLLETCWSGSDLMMPPSPAPPPHHHHHHDSDYHHDDNHHKVVASGSYDYLVHYSSVHDLDANHFNHHDGDGDYDYSSILHSPSSFYNDDDQKNCQRADVIGSGAGDVEAVRPKRRRARAKKNKEEVENQRMTHIAVERNRRKQMNDYLNALRSLMPDSYVPRGDQASIIGGAINFVKELEQNLQCLSAKKQMNDPNVALPFGEFFSFPQYSTTTAAGGSRGGPTTTGDEEHELKGESHHLGGGESVVDVEVTMVESHALVKIRTKQPPKQLSKLVSGLQGLRLTILHLNATKVYGVAFYSFSAKVEDDTRLSSVDEIAKAVYQLLGQIQEGQSF